MITALITMAGLTYLVIILMFCLYVSISRQDRKDYKAQIADLYCQVNAKSISEYAAASNIINPPVSSKLSKEDAKEFEMLKYRAAKEDNDTYEVGQ